MTLIASAAGLAACATGRGAAQPTALVTRCSGAAVLLVQNATSSIVDIYERRGIDAEQRIGSVGPGDSRLPLVALPNAERRFSARYPGEHPVTSTLPEVGLTMECA